MKLLTAKVVSLSVFSNITIFRF